MGESKMDKKPLIVVSICAVVLLVLGSLSNVVGYQTVMSTSVNDSPLFQTRTQKATNQQQNSINPQYLFYYAFVWGYYEKMAKDIYFFNIWNSNTNDTINVLGYDVYEHRWNRVMAEFVMGGTHVGFIGNHRCCIFTFSNIPMLVWSINDSSS
jgi:hypothetical protein